MDKRTSRTSEKDFLDYYHSPLAGQGPFYQLARHSRQLSTSSSDYSENKDATSTFSRDPTSSSDASSQVTRRSSTRSLSSVEPRLNTMIEIHPPSAKSPLTASEGSHTGHSRFNALDAAQTAAPSSTPPTTMHSRPDPASAHQRSASESLSTKKKAHPRDIGIVGTTQLTSSAKQSTTTNKIHSDVQSTNNTNSTTLHPPIFQQPKSASPSPSPSPEPTRSSAASTPIRGLNIMKRDRLRELHTASLPPPASAAPSPQPQPETGDEKGVHVPVALSIVAAHDGHKDTPVGGIRLVIQSKSSSSPVSTTPTPITTTTNTTLPPMLVLPKPSLSVSYVNYEPGVHSTAGPLPPPPRLPGFDSSSPTPLSPPPPRPPRLNSPLPPRNATRSKDIEAVKQALQLPPAVSAALASKSPATAESTEPPKEESTTTVKQQTAYTDTDVPSPAVIAVERSGPSSGPAIPPSPSISDSSISSYSMVQQTPSAHRREGAFPPSSSDVGSESIESERRKDDAAQKRTLTVDTTAASAPVVGTDDVPQVTIISEPTVPPSPILEEPSGEQGGNINGDDFLRPRHRRELGQVVVMSDNEDDSNENWVAVSRLSSPSPSTTALHDRSTSLDHLQRTGNGFDRESASRASSEAPSPPPKGFKNSLTTGLKRFSSRSLPRTPSISSGGSRRSSSVMSKRFSTGSASLGGGGGSGSVSANASNGGSRVAFSSRTPSPSALPGTTPPLSPLPPLPSRQPTRAATVHGHGVVSYSSVNGDAGFGGSLSLHGHEAPRVVRRQKIVVQWPTAMFINEIHTKGRKKLSTSERCAIYARKINELNMYDCGLTEWVVDMRFRGPNSTSGGGVNKKFLDARSPANASFTPQPRQSSRGSMVSDATFPTRADATTATDLLSSTHDDDGVYREDVPLLPYPSLATQQRAAMSNVVSIPSPNLATSMTPPASIRSLGSNSTSSPSMAGGGNNTPMQNAHTHNHTHTHTHSYSHSHSHPPSSFQAPSSTIPTTSAVPMLLTLSPISPTKHNSITSSTTTGFFASLGRKASLSSAKRPNLGLGGLSSLITSPISTSSSSSNGLGSSPHSTSHRLLTKSSTATNGAGTASNGVKQPVNVGGIQMNPSIPPSVAPNGPRAPPGSASNNGGVGMGYNNSHRVQRSKTFMPSTSSPFSSLGGGGSPGMAGMGSSGGGSGGYGHNLGIERRPSLWELQLNTSSRASAPTASPVSGPNTPTAMNSQTFSGHAYPNTPTPTHNGAGYQTTPSQQPQHQHHSQPYTATPLQYNHHHHHHPPQQQQHQQQQQQLYDPHSDPEFIHQVDKLADLLPHADRLVLAGYLKRAGQDVLAIGQYLEDEKNGTLKAY